jgi:hypothetical protein
VLEDKKVENLLLVGDGEEWEVKEEDKKLKYDDNMSLQDNQHLKNENF